MRNIQIELVPREDLQYGFHDKNPYFTFYSTREEVDPFPCYPHDMKVAQETIDRLTLRTDANIKVMPFESISRTNGWASKSGYYDYKEDGSWDYKYVHLIVLSGKRTPIMPAMTRYMIGHEYGHIVEHLIRDTLTDKTGINDGTDYEFQTKFLKEYAKFRGIEYSDKYGANNWHSNTQEVFANDYRILAAGIETDYWPHTFDHPDHTSSWFKNMWNAFLTTDSSSWKEIYNEYLCTPEVTTNES